MVSPIPSLRYLLSFSLDNSAPTTAWPLIIVSLISSGALTRLVSKECYLGRVTLVCTAAFGFRWMTP